MDKELSEQQAAEWLVANTPGLSLADAASAIAKSGLRFIPVAPLPWSKRALAARALELVRSGWCQHDQARRPGNVGSRWCAPTHPDAYRWSIDGAVRCAYAEALETISDRADTFRLESEFGELVDIIETAIDAEMVPWNDRDGRTQSDVVDVLAVIVARLGVQS